MDPTVQVAIVGGIFLVASAWIGRPARRTRRAVASIQQEFRNNGGSSTKDALDRIERGLNDVRTDVSNVHTDVAHLRGRFDQHVRDTERTHP